jgi:hypothetical protein
MTMTDAPDTLPVTFTYSHTRGVFTGHFHNGATFDFIAAADSPLPTKLRNALQALMSRAHTAFKSQRAAKPDMTDEEWNTLMEKIAAFEAVHGVTRHSPRKPKAPKRTQLITNLSLEDLGL